MTTQQQRERLVSLGFTSELFPAGTHMCYIFNDDRERGALIAQYLESGLREGEMVQYYAEKPHGRTVQEEVSALGVAAPPNLRPGQVVVAEAERIYCPDGTFVPERMVARLRSAYDEAIRSGYPGLRASDEMEWALHGLPGSERLAEYEALINTLDPQRRLTAICQYDARRFDGATIFDVLAVHPMMIVRGQVVRNPYYLPAEEFLARRRAQR